MLAEIRTGLIQNGEGAVSPARASRVGALISGDGQGRYYEQTSRGMVFSAGLTAWTSTVAAGNIILATAAPSAQFAVWNPSGSGRNLSLLKFQCYVISGTAPLPGVFHSAMAVAPSIASSVAATYGWFANNNVAMGVTSVARVVASQAGATLTGSSALTIIRASDLAIGAGALVPANLMQPKMTEYIDGDIFIPPGTGWVPTWQAAGTLLLGGYSVTWEEIPI